MREDINDERLIRYLLGEATLAEREQIEVWINANPANSQKLEQFRFLLQSSKELAAESPADKDEQWEKFKAKRDSIPDASIVRMHKPYTRWLQIAASLLLICGLATGGYYLYHRNSIAASALVIIKTQNNVLTDTLPDGSTVQLNKNSTITYTGNFKKQREIKLTGEAFFTVVHNANAPFNVNVGNVSIRDIGTSFNVKSKTGYLEVIVATGTVKVSRQAASIVLNRHEMIHIAASDKNLIKQTSDDLLYNYYRTNQFELNNTPLSHIVAVFNEIYNAHIKIEGKDLANLPITVPLKKDSLDKMLQVLLLTTPEIKMERKGGDIILKR